jgi:hypothetical protein
MRRVALKRIDVGSAEHPGRSAACRFVFAAIETFLFHQFINRLSQL